MTSEGQPRQGPGPGATGAEWGRVGDGRGRAGGDQGVGGAEGGAELGLPLGPRRRRRHPGPPLALLPHSPPPRACRAGAAARTGGYPAKVGAKTRAALSPRLPGQSRGQSEKTTAPPRGPAPVRQAARRHAQAARTRPGPRLRVTRIGAAAGCGSPPPQSRHRPEYLRCVYARIGPSTKARGLAHARVCRRRAPQRRRRALPRDGPDREKYRREEQLQLSLEK